MLTSEDTLGRISQSMFPLHCTRLLASICLMTNAVAATASHSARVFMSVITAISGPIRTPSLQPVGAFKFHWNRANQGRACFSCTTPFLFRADTQHASATTHHRMEHACYWKTSELNTGRSNRSAILASANVLCFGAQGSLAVPSLDVAVMFWHSLLKVLESEHLNFCAFVLGICLCVFFKYIYCNVSKTVTVQEEQRCSSFTCLTEEDCV